MLRVTRVSTLAILTAMLTSSLLLAETDQARMKRLYPVSPDGVFTIEPGITVKAVFDKHGSECTLTIFGEMSEDRVVKTFDMLVPANKRGSDKPLDMLECVGSCMRNVSYKNVYLVTGSVGKATSDPAAIIGFKRSNCKAAVAEAQKQVFHVNRNQ